MSTDIDRRPALPPPALDEPSAGPPRKAIIIIGLFKLGGATVMPKLRDRPRRSPRKRRFVQLDLFGPKEGHDR